VGAAATASASAMRALGYASGSHVVFAGTPSLHTAAHETAHALLGCDEQHADAVAAKVVAGQSAEALVDAFAGSRGSPSGEAPLQAAGLQMKFAGPTFDQTKGTMANQKYKEGFIHNGQKTSTKCGIHNTIITAGETLAPPKAASDPGTPDKMSRYQDHFSRTGGLVRESTLPQAATKMHLINHRLRDDAKTQKNPQNIFLGTKNSNNPTHLHSVENPIIVAVASHPTKLNSNYESDIGGLKKKQDNTGKHLTKKPHDVLFWPMTSLPDPKIVDHSALVSVEELASNPNEVAPVLTTGKRGPGARSTGKPGSALYINPLDPQSPTFRHLWIQYEVIANYSTPPPYVTNNVTTERKWVDGMYGAAVKAADAASKVTGATAADVEKAAVTAAQGASTGTSNDTHAVTAITNAASKAASGARATPSTVAGSVKKLFDKFDSAIKDFDKFWASEALPPTFTCKIDYYSATYDPTNLYLKESDATTIRADL
jgi:hypothetical protein